jgi:tetratricopeptide (TPR) repeat protein
MMQDQHDEAFDAFYKAVWNDAWQHAGYLNLARIATLRKDYEETLELIDKSLVKNYHSHTARHLKAAILRKLERYAESYALINASLEIDPFNFGCLFEKYLMLKAEDKPDEASSAATEIKRLSHNWVHNYIEYAFDFAHAGLYEEASELLLLYMGDNKDVYPMIWYYLGWFAYKVQQTEKAVEYFKKAAGSNPDFCFPNRIEDVIVLGKAIELNPQDAKAPYYLGNFWFDKRQYNDAIQCWENSVIIDETFPTVHRNLSLAYYNKSNDPVRSLASMEKAFALDTTDARVLMELDQLYKKLNTPHKQRLTLLENHLPLVKSREDLYLERIVLYNQLGEHQTAKELIANFKFNPWEGGEGKVVGQYLISHLELAKQAIVNGESQKALQLLHEAENYPLNLGEGKLFGTQENDIHYLKGLAYKQLEQQELAKEYFTKATQGISQPVQAIFYNDPQPDKIFYQGLAWEKLGEVEKAKDIFDRLIQFGMTHLDDHITIDYFAVSLPDLLVFDADLDLNNRIHCLYLMGLGKLGHGKSEEAESLFNEVLGLNINHQGAAIHKQMIKNLFSTYNSTHGKQFINIQ